jgi:hypothetical protein
MLCIHDLRELPMIECAKIRMKKRILRPLNIVCGVNTNIME